MPPKYKHVVLGLIFLKYISDAFEERHAAVLAEWGEEAAHATGNANGGAARGDISIYRQESNYTTWRLARMNLAIRGIGEQIARGDSFHNDRHPDLKADFILAHPPFNVSDWGGERLAEDKRWRYGVQRMDAHHLIGILGPTACKVLRLDRRWSP